MAKKVKENNLLVPDITGLELDIAGDILDDYGIKYEIQDKKIISFFVDKNCVVKTLPKKNKPIEPNEVLKIYPSKLKIGPILIVLIILSIIVFNYINKHTITPLLFGEPTIEQTNSNWDKSQIVYVTDDADFNYSTIDHYKYCINKSKSTSSCDWKDTYTKSITVSQSGTWYVWFKGISSDYNESSNSNRLKVQVDNEAPTITSIDKTITKRSIEIRISAKDSLSGINKYYYSINNQEFIEGNKSYTFTSLNENTTYDIKVRVVDKAGNKIDSTIKISTVGDNKITDTNKVFPQLSLVNVPSIITSKNNYYLPTSINGNYEDNTICYDDNNNKIDSTYDLSIGKHSIMCTTEIDNITVTNYKDIEVLPENGEDEIVGDYARINLSYPKEALEYMYRLSTSEVRLEEDGWKYYVGPIYINKEDINNVIIKYHLNGEKIEVRNDLYVDINPDSYTVKDDEETSVRISYNSTQDKVYYSVNESTYIEYTNSFKVKGNSLIKAYIIRTYKTYDKETDSIKEIQYTATDSVYIQNVYPSIGDKTNSDVSISLDIPNVIDSKETYAIPTNYSYGVHGVGVLKCYANNKLVNSTTDLEDGEYDLICTITAHDGETKVASKHIIVKSNNYKYDLDNLPGMIKVGYEYELDNTCNINNTNVLKEGYYTIVCDGVSKNIKVVKDDSLYIDISDIPKTIEVGSLYQLPSHYKGTNTKFIKCLDEENNLLFNTSTLSIGNHKITCIIETENGTTSIEKNVIISKPKYSIDILK